MVRLLFRPVQAPLELGVVFSLLRGFPLQALVDMCHFGVVLARVLRVENWCLRHLMLEVLALVEG